MFPRAQYRSASELDWGEIPDPVATIKYDGAHYFMRIEPDGSPRYFSRRESVKGHYPERTSQLPHLTDRKLVSKTGNVYSVELIHTGHDKFNIESHPKVSGILNSLSPRAIETQKQTGPVRAVLIDVVEPRLPTYKDKLLHMKEVETEFGKPDVLYAATPVLGIKDVVRLVDRTKVQGREGVIVTSLTKPEAINKRVKIKHVDTFNLRVVRVLQEIDIHGSPKNSMGALVVADASGREVANVGSGFTREEREEIWRDRANWTGRDIQVKTLGVVKIGGRLRGSVFNGLSDSGIDKIV